MTSKTGSPVYTHAAPCVSHGVSVGFVNAMPVLLLVQLGCVAVPLRYFVTPETCQSPSSHFTIGVSGVAFGIM